MSQSLLIVSFAFETSACNHNYFEQSKQKKMWRKIAMDKIKVPFIVGLT